MLDSQDTALDRRSKGAKEAGLSVQDPFPRKVGLLQRDTESAESEKDSCNNKRLDEHGAPLNHLMFSCQLLTLRTGRPQNIEAHLQVARRTRRSAQSFACAVRASFLNRRRLSITV